MAQTGTVANFNQQGDKYCGFKTWLICILGVPCIYCCPIDDVNEIKANFNQQGDKYCGFKTWLICLLGVPCIYCCPIDDVASTSETLL